MHTPDCPNCRSTDLLVVRLAPNETPMRFSTCRHCEHRWWEDVEEGTRSGLSLVLEQLTTS